MTDREVLARAKRDTQRIKLFLLALGYTPTRVFNNDNAINPGWVIDAVVNDGSGYTLNIEVIGSPWENDGTVEW